MKRYKHLWENFATMKTAKLAIERGTEHKRNDQTVRRKLCVPDPERPGCCMISPEKAHAFAERILDRLDDNWQHSPLTSKVIRPARSKERKIDCPCLEDHIVHWMLILTIKPALTRGMYHHSYGSLPGRGIEPARRAVERWIQHDKDSKYFVKLDIRKFYPNINQEILMQKLGRVIDDDRIMDVISKVVHALPKGLPIGTYSSQWFANFYLQDLDHYILQGLYKTRRGKRIKFVRHYERNMDDMLLIGSSKRDLEKAVQGIIEYCSANLGLEIKPSWEIKKIASFARKENGRRVYTPGHAPVDIVGYRYYREHTESRGTIFLHTQRLAARARRKLHHEGEVLLCHAQAIVSLVGWFSHASSESFLKKLNSTININFLKECISYAAKNGIVGNASRLYCCERGREGNYHVLHGRAAGRTRRQRCILCDELGRGVPLAT